MAHLMHPIKKGGQTFQSVNNGTIRLVFLKGMFGFSFGYNWVLVKDGDPLEPCV